MNYIKYTKNFIIKYKIEQMYNENDEIHQNLAKNFTLHILYTIIRKNLWENREIRKLVIGIILYGKEVGIMRERKIKMTPAEVQNFVNEASKCDFDIDISYNHYTVDAKSILGVMGLDFRSILTLQYAGYNDEFERYVNGLAIA